MRRNPLIEVLLEKVNLAGDPFRHGRTTAALQHGGVQLQTVDDEISMSESTEMYSQLNFQVAIAGTNADKPRPIVFPAVALLRKVSAEHFVWPTESESFQLRTHISL